MNQNATPCIRANTCNKDAISSICQQNLDTTSMNHHQSENVTLPTRQSQYNANKNMKLSYFLPPIRSYVSTRYNDHKSVAPVDIETTSSHASSSLRKRQWSELLVHKTDAIDYSFKKSHNLVLFIIIAFAIRQCAASQVDASRRGKNVLDYSRNKTEGE